MGGSGGASGSGTSPRPGCEFSDQDLFTPAPAAAAAGVGGAPHVITSVAWALGSTADTSYLRALQLSYGGTPSAVRWGRLNNSPSALDPTALDPRPTYSSKPYTLQP